VIKDQRANGKINAEQLLHYYESKKRELFMKITAINEIWIPDSEPEIKTQSM
jgi:hypothetical protein